MFTFLPKEYKKEVLKEYRKKILLIGLLFTNALFLCATILMFPAYVATLSYEKEIAFEKDRIGVSEDVEIGGGIEMQVKEVERMIGLLEKQVSKEPIMIILERVLSQKRIGVSVTAMSVARTGGEDNRGIITLEGVATTRDGLVSFSRDLKGDPTFIDVDLPVSSLAKSINVPFTIRIEAKLQ